MNHDQPINTLCKGDHKSNDSGKWTTYKEADKGIEVEDEISHFQLSRAPSGYRSRIIQL